MERTVEQQFVCKILEIIYFSGRISNSLPLWTLAEMNVVLPAAHRSFWQWARPNIILNLEKNNTLQKSTLSFQQYSEIKKKLLECCRTALASCNSNLLILRAISYCVTSLWDSVPKPSARGLSKAQGCTFRCSQPSISLTHREINSLMGFQL